MLPIEIEPELLSVPLMERPTIVISTGDEPRHRRFALRLQEEFPELVTEWYQFQSPPAPPEPSLATRAKTAAKILLGRDVEGPRLPSIFEDEVTRLEACAVVSSTSVAAGELQNGSFAERLKAASPYFFLTLGGGLYPKNVLECVRGLAINQHAGYAPDYKGTHTTEQALYNRRLDRIGVTVHLTATGADSGAILRRSQPCLNGAELSFHVFERVVALGTELMVEIVRDILSQKPVYVFPQPLRGTTYLGEHYDLTVRRAIGRDEQAGWLTQELQRRRRW